MQEHVLEIIVRPVRSVMDAPARIRCLDLGQRESEIQLSVIMINGKKSVFRWTQLQKTNRWIHPWSSSERSFYIHFFAGPVGAVGLHYGDCLDDVRYNDILVSACAKYGIAAFTGDGLDSNVMVAATKAIGKTDGIGIPTVKPWNIDTVAEKMKMVQESKAFAVAMDVDAAGLPFLKNMEPPAGSKTVEELGEIAKIAGIPFIVKGVMTVRGALKAKEAGASAIVVSNHGGRVLDQCPATAEVLEEIARAVGDSMKIFVDGGIRSGVDVFKALALGADAVIIARPFVTAVYGGAEEGVKSYIDKIGTELEDTMKMCGVTSLKEITRASVWMK